MQLHKVRVEQCEAAQGIEAEFGTDKALDYLIGEKFINFLEAAEDDDAFRGEIPDFVAEIKTIFESWQLAECLEIARQTAPFDSWLRDGGVYENLGVTCMEPGRDADYSTNVYSPEYVICCDAGPGQFDDTAHPHGWATRMARSFETTHRQVQHRVQTRLHQWREHNVIKDFFYSYLGQQDRRLPAIPPEFVPREGVVNYPTEFSPMPESDIIALSDRGEHLTRLLIDHDCPELRAN